MPHFVKLDEVASTNTFVKQEAATLHDMTVVYTPRQLAGRGQKGNSWESEPGKNLTFSMLIKRPQVPVKQQFAISEAVSLAIATALEPLVPVRIKWPNDIYCGDCKLAGILIENDLDNEGIVHTIVGVGLNVNQEVFVSDAPNPTSLALLTGRQHELLPLLNNITTAMEHTCHFDGTGREFVALHKRYLELLYRHDGKPHGFTLPGDEDNPFMATIEGVAPDGMLALRHTDGVVRHYAFKEVAYLI